MPKFWANLKLSQRYALASFFVLLVSSFVIGSWVTKEIERGVVQNSGSTTAAYVETFIAPVMQDLRYKDRLSPESIAIFDKLMDPNTAEQPILSIKLWKNDGSIAFHTDEDLTGQTFPISSALKAAFEGEVVVEFDELHDAENAHEREANVPFMEIYNPVWRNETGEVFAVAELYVDATELQSELRDVQISSWAIVGSVTLVVYGLLFGIVRGGSQTIARQQDLLQQRVTELSAMQEELQLASRRTSEINEKFLRRIGSELHDGPAQLIGLALLKLDALRPAGADEQFADSRDGSAFQTVKNSLDDTLTEIRVLSAGLALPVIENLTPSEIVQKAVDIHETRTGMVVNTSIDPVPRIVSQAIGISIYRFIQEALTNVFRHSGVDTATVSARSASGQVTITVEDEGVGYAPPTGAGAIEHLGLVGLRERIQSIGGRFKLDGTPGRGTTVTATLYLDECPTQTAAEHVKKTSPHTASSGTSICASDP